MSGMSANLARRLASNAEAVCRHYLSNGKREGNYWLVGDARNAKGRSLYVRLKGPDSGKGAAGKWTDAATGEHGDLLDIIASVCALDDHRDVIDEARRFLGPPGRRTPRGNSTIPRQAPSQDSTSAAQRLFASAQPIVGTLAETYLRSRGIADLREGDALRFHPRCLYRSDRKAPQQIWPAIIAAVTNLDSEITGVQRTWLARDGSCKAALESPRRAMGALLGNGVRFGTLVDIIAVGEGVETVLSLRCILPTMPMVAALSAQHLSALALPPSLKRLYIAVDRDPAGERAADILGKRANAAGIDASILTPTHADFNDDLRRMGVDAMAASIRPQLAPDDIECLLIKR